MPKEFAGGQKVRWMSEALGGEQRGRVHCAWPDHWSQDKKDGVPVLTDVALVLVEADRLETVDS